MLLCDILLINDCFGNFTDIKTSVFYKRGQAKVEKRINERNQCLLDNKNVEWEEGRNKKQIVNNYLFPFAFVNLLIV